MYVCTRRASPCLVLIALNSRYYHATLNCLPKKALLSSCHTHINTYIQVYMCFCWCVIGKKQFNCSVYVEYMCVCVGDNWNVFMQLQKQKQTIAHQNCVNSNTLQHHQVLGWPFSVDDKWRNIADKQVLLLLLLEYKIVASIDICF